MSDDLDRLRRWEDAGGTFKVLGRTPTEVVVALLTCDAGEEIDRFRSGQAALLAYLDTPSPPGVSP
ncbi:hypothetical protein [Jidongwangia harbinensis]|uniref:hypothetical protein n=1 Tax=Jidongwangia harbinensis TaxID=2878561 RepID=UPI001CD93E5D|nr:hypothetical protein [Jidongwangia harbinensis]MCA2214367.1 hypothetical protein [Jidongwangia harbinensis]